MLAERFQILTEQRLAAAARIAQARAARDAFVAVEFPSLNNALLAMVQAVTGSDPRLAVTTSTAVQAYPGHSFGSLSAIIIEVRSTFYGPVELVRFTPSLESVSKDQFGIVRIETENIPDLPAATSATAIRNRGVLMIGTSSSALAVPSDGNLAVLTPDLLEQFLATLFIRTR